MKPSLLWIVFVCTLCFLFGFFYRFTQIESFSRHYPHEIHEDTQSGSSPAPAPSPEDKELQNLLTMTAWNIAPLPGAFQLSTSHRTSSYTLLHPRPTYTMGETIEVLITVKDHKGRPKTYGGDFFNVKLYSASMKAGVSGSVQDYNNGTYTATFLLVWPGETKISVRLIHSSEAIAILHEKRDSRPDKVYFHGHFQLNGTREVVECNFDLPGRDVCEYYDAGSGEKWVCLRPKNLPCNSYREHSSGGNRDILNNTEKQFLSMSFTDQEIPNNLKPLNVLPTNISRDGRRTKCTSGLPIPDPSGFYYRDLWESLVCSNQHFPDGSSVASCLAGKSVYMFGDSTLRQWWEHIVDFVPYL
ncbi:NXPE family member 3-like isoform X2 [Xenopus tropicalis]|uniref:NXPE family member 3-like isoform X2 n=1 Tax=Xenopus tropicalis TaxID=8364 RepID=A0A8J1JC37_XENTR|nr:NXPE family member 3-like isoform X2 [Xenopus tropicalis]